MLRHITKELNYLFPICYFNIVRLYWHFHQFLAVSHYPKSTVTSGLLQGVGAASSSKGKCCVMTDKTLNKRSATHWALEVVTQQDLTQCISGHNPDGPSPVHLAALPNPKPVNYSFFGRFAADIPNPKCVKSSGEKRRRWDLALCIELWNWLSFFWQNC